MQGYINIELTELFIDISPSIYGQEDHRNHHAKVNNIGEAESISC